MEHWIQISDEMTIGEQPDANDIQRLADNGFQSVVNLQTRDEDSDDFGIDDERETVHSQGMTFKHIPVSIGQMDQDKVDEFSEAITYAPLPAFVHCKSGLRAGAFSLMHLALERGWSGDKALQIAEQMGFECKNDTLRDFVREYITEQNGSRKGP